MKCTHVALQVRDLDRSVAFYELFCNMKVVSERQEPDGRVVWMGWGEDPPHFVIVLLERDYSKNEQPPWQHIGISVSERNEVDRVYQLALSHEAAIAWPPRDGGPIVGYMCGLSDPDGNVVEFSFGQRLG